MGYHKYIFLIQNRPRFMIMIRFNFTVLQKILMIFVLKVRENTSLHSIGHPWCIFHCTIFVDLLHQLMLNFDAIMFLKLIFLTTYNIELFREDGLLESGVNKKVSWYGRHKILGLVWEVNFMIIYLIKQ